MRTFALLLALGLGTIGVRPLQHPPDPDWARVEAAKAGRMKCVAVSFVGHHPAEKLRLAGADLVVQSLEQVSVETMQRLFRT